MDLRLHPAIRIALLSLLAGAVSCGGHSSGTVTPVNLSIMLTPPRLVLRQGGVVSTTIVIVAPTEAVQLQINSLPSGVTATYAATDTNPSGTIRLMATDTAALGTFMPSIMIATSGSTASQSFVLEIDAKAKP